MGCRAYLITDADNGCHRTADKSTFSCWGNQLVLDLDYLGLGHYDDGGSLEFHRGDIVEAMQDPAYIDSLPVLAAILVDIGEGTDPDDCVEYNCY